MAESRCVFVHRDGHWDQRVIPFDANQLPVYRVPVRQPLKWSIDSESAPPYEPPRTIDYTQRGKMFDGTPIYCANGWEVLEAFNESLIANSTPDGPRATIESQARSMVFELIEKECRVFHILDDKHGYIPFTDKDYRKHQDIGLYRAGLIVAHVMDRET